MSFDVAGDVYGRFMGRYSEPLAVPIAAFAGVAAGQRVLDVGCGPGALTAHLGSITEPTLVAAVDPSPPFVAAAAARCPGSEVQLGAAESLPYPDASFDGGARRARRAFHEGPGCRPAGDGPGDQARRSCRGVCVGRPHRRPRALWDAVHEIDPEAEDEAAFAGARRGHLAELFDSADLRAIESESLTVEVVHPSFEEWWEPYTLGVGPAGDYVARLDDEGRQRLAAVARARLSDGPFTVSATAWAARGMRAPSA